MECISWGFKPSPEPWDFPGIISFISDPEAKILFSEQQKEVYSLPSGLISSAALRVSWPPVLQSSCRITVQFLHLFLSAKREPFISNPPAADKWVQIESLLWFNGVEFTEVASPLSPLFHLLLRRVHYFSVAWKGNFHIRGSGCFAAVVREECFSHNTSRHIKADFVHTRKHIKPK